MWSFIRVSVTPRDRTHENYVISKMNLSFDERMKLRDEINWRMQNETTDTKIIIENIGPALRTPRELN